ncbi:hypothetical protein [Streptomyces sp. NPDC056190]|uniref:hypothetical protein n=1 Tax=Streptomyces sp. NPDC056190 TaxID=3345741 RepID=UPI0035DE49F7
MVRPARANDLVAAAGQADKSVPLDLPVDFDWFAGRTARTFGETLGRGRVAGVSVWWTRTSPRVVVMLVPASLVY